MKVVDLNTYNQNYLGTIDRSKVFFNPDNSVSIFEEGDENILSYLTENAEKLRASGTFYMNAENYNAIRDWLEKNPQKEKLGEPSIATPMPAQPILSKEDVEELLFELKDEVTGKSTVAKLTECIEKLVEKLSS